MRLPKGDDAAAANDQGTAQQNRQCRQGTKGKIIDDLPNREQCRDIETNQLSKLKRSKIEERAIAKQ